MPRREGDEPRRVKSTFAVAHKMGRRLFPHRSTRVSNSRYAIGCGRRSSKISASPTDRDYLPASPLAKLVGAKAFVLCAGRTRGSDTDFTDARRHGKDQNHDQVNGIRKSNWEAIFAR